MNARILSKKDLRLRLQAARLQERTLPDQVRRAYGDAPAQAGGPADEAMIAEARTKARASLIDKGLLTADEFETLPVAEAANMALQRLREQMASLQTEQAQDRTNSESFGIPPRTLRR